MSPRMDGELSLAMALALESCETDVENALQLLGRALHRMETVRQALGWEDEVPGRKAP
jgi:hypothetical protein